MARLKPAPAAQYVPAVGPDALKDLQIFANRPELAKAFVGFCDTVLQRERILPNRLHELVRLRIAFHNQCRNCMAARYVPEDDVSEDLVCSLEKPEESEDLTDPERAALEYADRLATDHLSIGDAFYDRLREHFTEPEIVELGVNIALCLGFGRLEATWDVIDDLPQRFTERGVTITPWGEGEVVRS